MNNNFNKIQLLERDPVKFDIIDLYNIISREKKLTLNNNDDKDYFLKIINNSLTTNFSDTMIYGKYVETMFSYIVASLGNCKLIKKEDCGDIFSETNILIPDYRIILNNNNQILIEVKNFYQRSSLNNYKISKKNFNKLLAYSNLMNVDILFAIYWSKWNYWTLVTPDLFKIEGNNMILSITEAIINNKMGILGDFMIATIPPLSVRIYANPKYNRDIVNGKSEFIIQKLEFYSDNKLITDKVEKNIALNLIMFGDWQETSNTILENNSYSIKYIEFKYYPKEYDNENKISIVANISELITRQYNYETISNGKIKTLSPSNPVSSLGMNISTTYKSKNLPLWFFYIKNDKNDINTS